MIFSQQIQRHGDRSPTEVYPNDPHKDHKWRGGLGALSLRGSRQMYDLGTNLRTRYYRLLPTDGYYTKDIIYVSSSYAERCIMSAQSFLAGFMPPLDNMNPLPIKWQPIPINSMPRDRDNVTLLIIFFSTSIFTIVSLEIFSSSHRKWLVRNTMKCWLKCTQIHHKKWSNLINKTQNCFRIWQLILER